MERNGHKMKVNNEMRLNFVSKSANESLARSAVSSFIGQLDPSIEELADIRTAVSEAVTNSIVHGYRGVQGIVEMSVKILDNDEVYIRIRDKGCGIADINKAMEPLFTTAPEEDRAGLGFAVMESFMDKLRVKSKVGAGTTITMRKVIRRTDITEGIDE